MLYFCFFFPGIYCANLSKVYVDGLSEIVCIVLPNM